MNLLRTFSDEAYRSALELWAWLDLTGKVPLCTSPFGDVFLQGHDGIWYLDLLEGDLEIAFDDLPSMHEVLLSDEGQDRYLLAGLAQGAERRGLSPGPDEVYGFRLPPVLGGTMEVDDIVVMSFVVAGSLSGQLHRQVRDLPPGTSIGEFIWEGTVPGNPERH